jgi:hypothetical protein
MPNDIVRASATALPNSSRRAALGLFASASTVVLAFAGGAPAAAAVSAGDDAEHFDLIRIWEEKAALTTAASRVHDETDEREHSVPAPAALVRTEEDAGLYLCEPAVGGGSYNSSEIERFRHGPLSRYDYRGLIKPDGVPSDDARTSAIRGSVR